MQNSLAGGAGSGGGGGGVLGGMDETHLSVFHAVSNRAHRKALEKQSLLWLNTLSTLFFSQTRDYDIHVT